MTLRLNQRITITLMCCVLMVSSTLAGQWVRTHESKENKTTAEVTAEIFLLKDKKLTPCSKTPTMNVPLIFHPAKSEQKMLTLAPGEYDMLHVYYFYSTVETEEGVFGTIVTVVAVPKKPHMPVLWEPRHFRKMNHMGIGDENENALQTLAKIKALPLVKNSSNENEPWKDYDLWVFKDYSKPFSLAVIDEVFRAQAAGEKVNFQIHFEEVERRPDGYKYPSTIDEKSISVKIDSDSKAVVSFEDLAPVGEEKVLYELSLDIRRIYGWSNNRTLTSAYKEGNKQSISLGGPLPANKDFQISITSRRSSYGNHGIKSVKKTFKSIPNSTVGSDKEDGSSNDHPHLFDLNLSN